MPISSDSSRRSSRQTSRKRCNQTTGWLAEELVAQWLRQQGGEIMQRRWHCRWGELDLIAQFQADAARLRPQATIAFVEVKSRREGNWDLNGLLAITPQKQQKLWKTAELFLSDYPQLADLPCRFDVALVHIHAQSLHSQNLHVKDLRDTAELGDRDSFIKFTFEQPIEIDKPVTLMGYDLSLQHYIDSAFDLA